MQKNIKQQKRKLVYSTGDVARVLQVSVAAVVGWCESEPPVLKSYVLPGGVHKRITHENLVEFSERFDVPLFFEEEATEKSPS